MQDTERDNGTSTSRGKVNRLVQRERQDRLGDATENSPVGECRHCDAVFWDQMAKNGHNCPEAPEDETSATSLGDFAGGGE
jgi:hypothetical protein